MATTKTLLQPAWLGALTRPETYPHPVSQVHLSETPISWVIQTGGWSYKLKKPVDFGFIDFTTLELRQAACREEVRLSQHTSPDFDTDVVTLTEEPSGPRFGGTGRILEYAVRTRQSAQES